MVPGKRFITFYSIRVGGVIVVQFAFFSVTVSRGAMVSRCFMRSDTLRFARVFFVCFFFGYRPTAQWCFFIHPARFLFAHCVCIFSVIFSRGNGIFFSQRAAGRHSASSTRSSAGDWGNSSGGGGGGGGGAGSGHEDEGRTLSQRLKRSAAVYANDPIPMKVRGVITAYRSCPPEADRPTSTPLGHERGKKKKRNFLAILPL